MEECVNYCNQMGFPRFSGILHIGAHVGEEISQYHKCGIKQILWVEGNKNLMKDLYDNTKMFPVKQQYLCEVLSDKDGTQLKFNITNNGQSSSILSLGTHKQHHPQVHVVEEREVTTSRFDTVYRKNMAMIVLEDLDFINIDVQGAELKVLKGFGDLLNKYRNIRVIYSEINEEYVYEQCCLVGELDEFLLQFGFKRVLTRMTEYKWGDSVYFRK